MYLNKIFIDFYDTINLITTKTTTNENIIN